MNFNFELKKALTDEEFCECFDFMKSFLVSIYGKESIYDENFKTWKENRRQKENRFFIKILKDMQTCGYAELMILNNNMLYFCDIIIKDQMRMTRVIFEFVKFVLDLEQFKNYNEIYFHINKKNEMSLKTWSKLGLILVEENKNNYKYKLIRDNINRYFKSIKRK